MQMILANVNNSCSILDNFVYNHLVQLQEAFCFLTWNKEQSLLSTGGAGMLSKTSDCTFGS